MKEKVLFFRPDHIGDLLLTTPAIHSLKKSFPELNLTAGVGSWSAEILKYNPYIDDISIINLPWLARDTKASYIEMIKKIFQLRRSNYDHIFSFRIAAKSALVSYILGGKKRWGFDVVKSRWAFTDKVSYNTKKHVVENYLDIIETFGAKRENNGLEIFIRDEERSNFIKRFALPDDYVVISPGAGYSPKLWISERWAEIADWVRIDLKIPVVVTGSNSEKPIIKKIISEMKGKYINLCGKLSIRELAVLIEKCKLLISVDSATMHIASALNTPLIALFGFTDPVQWGPYPVKNTNSVIFKRLKNQKFENSMKNIEVEDVKRAVEHVIFTK